MMGWSPQCYIPSFVEIGPPVPGKIFDGFTFGALRSGNIFRELGNDHTLRFNFLTKLKYFGIFRHTSL